MSKAILEEINKIQDKIREKEEEILEANRRVREAKENEANQKEARGKIEENVDKAYKGYLDAKKKHCETNSATDLEEALKWLQIWYALMSWRNAYYLPTVKPATNRRYNAENERTRLNLELIDLQTELERLRRLRQIWKVYREENRK